jgi:WD40 repeat protein
VHDLARDTLVRTFSGHQRGIRAVALDRTGQVLAAASDDATVRLWNVDTGEALAIFTGHDGGATRLAFSPNAQRVLAITGRSARIWSLAPEDALNVLRGHASYVYDIAFLDDQRIISGAWDRTLRVWSTRTRAEMTQWPPPKGIPYAIAFAPQARPAGVIATAHDSSVSLWDGSTSAHLTDLNTNPSLRTTSASLSADGSRLAARTVKDVIVWHTADAVELLRASVPVAQDLCKVALSPDGRWVAADGPPGEILIWEVGGSPQPRRLLAAGQVVCALAFNRDGSLLASGSRGADTAVRLWDVRSGAQLQQFIGHADNVYALAFGPDETRLASGSNDTTVRVWDLASGEQVAQFNGHDDYVYSLAFSPDGTLLASGSGDTTIRLWDTVPLHLRWRERASAAETNRGE